MKYLFNYLKKNHVVDAEPNHFLFSCCSLFLIFWTSVQNSKNAFIDLSSLNYQVNCKGYAKGQMARN
jgi:hypothetical protein